ncbi:tetratricopeptide repeat protein [Marinagarivorans algicola]|uniref:tetratricopeptide repeat protein n=1 Tax=Marinagarivorans algicola TaxID=1513270 RepID=UPI0006B9DCF5|nr:hypothetical protein [Marinagarivorans algicola]
MAAKPTLVRQVSVLLKKHGWDIEYFKGFVLGLVWLDLFREHSRYEAFLDLPENALNKDENALLGAYALQLSNDILMERFRFSAGCSVDKSSLSANYKKSNKLFQWASGVHMACRIVEVMIEDGDLVEDENSSYLLARIGENVYPLLDKDFAIDFFSELNECKINEAGCIDLLVRLRSDLPKLIRDITLSSQMLTQTTSDYDHQEEYHRIDSSAPIGNIHGYFATLTDEADINDCIDDLLPSVMMGNKSERIKNVEALLKYAEKALGEDFFVDNKGYFWGLIETRTYMRTLTALAEVYKVAMQREKAVECYEKSLSLCKEDNLGARYLLADLYLELRRADDALKLIEQFKDDAGAMMLFTKALALFIKYGDSPKAAIGLKEAVESNEFIALMLVGKMALPKKPPEYYGLGDENEAALYVMHNRLLWINSPGAIDWLTAQQVRS